MKTQRKTKNQVETKPLVKYSHPILIDKEASSNKLTSFPYRAFLNRSLEEKIKLCTHKKLGICGKVIKSKDISYDFFDATLLAPKSVTFMQFKPYLLCNQILVYLHPFVLEYSHVLELLAEDCFLVTKRYLEILLSYKKLNITISEWDTLMMLLHLET